MSVLGKRKDCPAIDAGVKCWLETVCEWMSVDADLTESAEPVAPESVEIAHEPVDLPDPVEPESVEPEPVEREPVDPELPEPEPAAAALLLDVLRIELLFENIVKKLFALPNGVESYVSLALVSRRAYQSATHAGLAKRVLEQCYPYLPRLIKTPSEWLMTDAAAARLEIDLVKDENSICQLNDKQAFSLIHLLSKPRSNLSPKGAANNLYEHLVYGDACATTSMRLEFTKDGPVQHRYYCFDPTESTFDRDGNLVFGPRMVACCLERGRLTVYVSWLTEATGFQHVRKIMFWPKGENYSIEIAGDAKESKVHVVIYDDARPFRLQQLTIDYTRIGECQQGVSNYDDEDLDPQLARDAGLCECAEGIIGTELHGCAGRGVSGHIYDFQSLIEKRQLVEGNKRGRVTFKKIAGISGIAKYMLACRLTPRLAAHINLRNHTVSYIERGGAILALDRLHYKHDKPEWYCTSNICVTALKTATTARSRSLPHFVYVE